MKAHETVMEWVTHQLRTGELQIGDHLPSERALAEQVGVSRASAREALRVLEALGMLRVGTGSGPSSGTVITAVPERALTLALNLQLVTRHVEYADMLEARLLLEVWAAEHSDPELGDWSRIDRALELMDDPDLSVGDFLQLDAELHVLLARTAGNPLIGTLMEALRASVAEHTLAAARTLPDWRGTADRLRVEHRAIAKALRQGDAAAASLLRDHIAGYYRETTA